VDLTEFEHMIRFTAFLEIRLNPGIRDISLCTLFRELATLICRWVKPTAVHPREHRHSVPPEPSDLPLSLVPGFNQVSRKALKRI